MQLTTYDQIKPENIFFKETKEFTIPNSKMKYKRIPIEVQYPNGKKGPLVIETPFLFSFGVSEKKNQETDKKIGYSLPVCLWGKDAEPNEKEKAFFDTLNKIRDICLNHLVEDYGPDVASSLSSLFYYKKVEYTDKKGKKKTRQDETAAPVLYAKLIYSDKSKKILSLFKNKNKEVNPFKFVDQYCNVRLALIIEGIFINKSVVSIQIKVHECQVKELKPRESLLKPIDEESESDDETDEKSEDIEDLVISDVEEE